MNTAAIDRLYASLKEQLSEVELRLVEMKVVGPSGLSIRIEGEHCLTSINVWPNGCCDVDYLYVSSEKGEFKHFEFQGEQEAQLPVLQEIRRAIERA